MKYDTKVRVAEISILLLVFSLIAFFIFWGYKSFSNNSLTMDSKNQKSETVETSKEPTDPSYLKHKKFLVENDCWVILVVRNQRSANFHYQCLKAPHFYTYRSIFYYPSRDYYNHIDGMTEVERLQKQIAVNKQIKPNYFESAY